MASKPLITKKISISGKMTSTSNTLVSPQAALRENPRSFPNTIKNKILNKIVHIRYFTFLFNMLFFLGQILLLGKSFPKVQLLQIPITICFSLLIDLVMAPFEAFKPASYGISLLILIGGCLVMALGITLAVKADLILTPGNAFVKAPAKCTGKSYGTMEILFDTILTPLAVTASFLLFGKFRGVREGPSFLPS